MSNAHAPAADAFNSGVAMAATAAAAAAAAAAQRLASQVVLEQKGGKAAAEQQTPSTPPTGVDSAAGVGMSTRTNSRQASKRGVSPESGGDDKAGGLSPEKGRRRRHHSSSSESPEKGERGKHRSGRHHSSKSKPGRSKKGGSGFGDARDATAAESGDLLTRSKLAATIAPDPVKPSGISISPQNTGAGGSGGTGLEAAYRVRGAARAHAAARRL